MSIRPMTDKERQAAKEKDDANKAKDIPSEI